LSINGINVYGINIKLSVQRRPLGWSKTRKCCGLSFNVKARESLNHLEDDVPVLPDTVKHKLLVADKLMSRCFQTCILFDKLLSGAPDDAF
jgi:hypothetical protein